MATPATNAALQRRDKPTARLLAIGAMGDDLGEQRVVVRRHGRTLLDARVDPDPLPFREAPGREPPGRGREIGRRVFGVEPGFDGVSADRDVLLREGQGAALRDMKLQADEIDSRHGLGHRVLDLDPRVHFEEVEAALFRQQKLDRAGAHIANRGRSLDRRRAHRGAKLGRHGRRRRLLDQLLVAALDRAIAFAEVDDRALLVAEHLHFDVAGADERALDQEPSVAESACGLRRGGVERASRVRRPHARRACRGRRRLRPL